MENFNGRETNVVEKCVHQFSTIPTFVICRFLVDSLKESRPYKGFIEDISLNELSLELTDDYLTIQESLLKYSTLEMTVILHFPDDLHKVNLTGIIRLIFPRKSRHTVRLLE